MKKLFFFRSSASSSGNNSDPLTDKQIFQKKQLEGGFNNQADDNSENNFRSPRGLFSKSRKQVSDSQDSNTCSGLRRSRSLSSAAHLGDGLGQSRSPSSSANSDQHHQSEHLFQRRALTPESQTIKKRLEAAASSTFQGLQRHNSDGSSRTHPDLSGNSSICSSNVSSKILDRYIDGEQQQERSRQKTTSSQKNYNGKGNGGGRLPPRVQYTAPTSPIDSVRDKPRSHSFREAKDTCLHLSSRDWMESGFGNESPRRLARNVIERLSQFRVIPETGSKEFDHGIPITIEDIYNFDSNSNVVTPKSYSLDEPYERLNGYCGEEFSSFQEKWNNCEGLHSVDTEEDMNVELRKRCKEAEKRFMLFSEELEQELILQDCGCDVPALVQTIRNLAEDRRSLALEVSGLLQSQIVERVSAREEHRLAKEEMKSQIKRLEKEKTELQVGLEKELDRRSSDWSLKLEKCQLEEQRLRDRVRELAEQNVSLQREVSSFSQRETESRSVMAYAEKQLKDLTTRVEEVSGENQNLGENLSEVQDKYRAAEEDRDCLKINFEEKAKECKELHKSITRLLRTCSEQEKTINALREGFSEEIGKKQSLETVDKRVAKLQVEQMRLTGVEMALRREVESCRIEVDSLRHENINLLNRLKGNENESDAITFKLDKEMWMRICCLQNQGLSMLTESNQLCSKLLEFIKRKPGQVPQSDGFEANGLDAQFIIESDMKVMGFKRGTESLRRSLQTMSSLLQEKSSLTALKSQSQSMDGSGKLTTLTSEDTMRSELKAESLLTNLLREKLYSKELEVEQLQAELAAAVRGNDILRCEVQNAMDNFSCSAYKLKDLELQMMKKDENITQLQNSLHESTKEVKILKGILAKVSEERDVMWEEVKQCSEKNMLLNSEVNILRKKVESLDEDILLKEGQITILKDTIGNKPFDLLASPDSLREFRLQ